MRRTSPLLSDPPMDLFADARLSSPQRNLFSNRGDVYRGSAMPSVQGTYFYADFCARFVRSFRYQNGQPREQKEWPLLSPPGGLVSSFGEDASGEMYFMNQQGGLFKLIPN